MRDEDRPGFCPRCGSAETKHVEVKPPKVKKRGGQESETFHWCTSTCERKVRFCTACHLVTPLPVSQVLSQHLSGSEATKTAQ